MITINDQNLTDATIDEIIRSINYMIKDAIKNTSKMYTGIIVSNNNDGRWNIQYNGETHPVTPHRLASPSVGQMVTIFVPQGNQAVAFFM